MSHNSSDYAEIIKNKSNKENVDHWVDDGIKGWKESLSKPGIVECVENDLEIKEFTRDSEENEDIHVHDRP